ncbi:MAG TPA: hypothetical protein VMT16_04600, partial [Thermoanaerobaculia bacterium]|nr:hypothetical protein [Thermoanaerobaculia bacterium]
MTSTTTRRAVALLAACTLSPSAAQEGPAPLPEGRPTQVLSVELRDLPGASRVRVTAAAPLQWTSSRTETGIVVELADAEPGPAVPYELSGGSGPVTRVRLHVRGGDDWRSVQLWIDTSGGGEPAVRAEGSSLEIDVPSSAPGTATADAPATLLHSFVPTPRHEPEPYRIAA